jgi:hypothetical protein
MHLNIDSELNVEVNGAGCQPIVFVPEVNVYALDDPNIIESF